MVGNTAVCPATSALRRTPRSSEVPPPLSSSSAGATVSSEKQILKIYFINHDLLSQFSRTNVTVNDLK